ncbi:shufflon system plasmid conjugative transfer pilus tip adhesin PilV [Burkholderia vietnamiensis]|uniref:Shufflon system plasmid conjugative transfer pilus tip adhesin PilV n=1 Tax=Burkholderia vietnamiensis TaxID=60552 RepID=A0ABS1AQW2_BURVI|nr:shufflon system plasmid conjugative transfer pilus tip adhesin PilV [Burkholderia vietnamiensis]MBJ9686542.1 shufflon system plasmid conjugative transfer pilus tip adhesin PilV [Burkholderia vietnamiensis]
MKSNIERQRGAITLVETLGVLIVASLVMPAVWGWLSDDADAKINRATADHDKQVVLAAAQYIKDNYAVALANATASTPATITVPMLQSQYPQMFGTGFSAKNPYAQTVTIQAYQPTAGTLDTVIVTSGGQAISEGNMRKIAQLVGGAGGYISSANPNVANGIYGAWGPKTIPSSPGAGHMVYSLMFQNGALVSDYLYRKAVPGHPELNQMNTAIDMGGNNLNNAATVNAQKVVAPAGNNVQVGNSSYYGDGANSAIRQNGALYVQNAAGTAAADVNTASVNASANVNASLDVNASRDVNAGGSVTSGSRLYVNEYVQVNGWATEGGACAPNGLIAKSGNGPLFCQSGLWTALGSGLGVGQSWSYPPRAMNVTYQNITSKPIEVAITGYCGAAGPGSSNYVRMYVDGAMVGGWYASLSDAADGGSATAIVPSGSTYYVTYNNSLCGLFSWAELS